MRNPIDERAPKQPRIWPWLIVGPLVFAWVIWTAAYVIAAGSRPCGDPSARVVCHARNAPHVHYLPWRN